MNKIYQLESLFTLLEQPRKIVLLTHTNPDGDAIGSSLAMYHSLVQRGHTVTAVVPNEIPDFLLWMPGVNNILVYENREKEVNAAIEEADLFFCLDFNSIMRLEALGRLVAQQASPKVLIDHHLQPEDFAAHVLWDTSFSSTCELVYDFHQRAGWLDSASKECLTCIYTGILTDTGGFVHATSPRLFRTVADLNERGIDNYSMQDLVFNTYTEHRMRLLGFCLWERMEILPEYQAGIMALSFDDHVVHNISRGDMEGVVNYMLKINGIKCAVLISQRRQEVKLSLRSKGDFNVQEICREYFNGGGHKNASGGTSPVKFQETIQLVKEILRKTSETR